MANLLKTKKFAKIVVLALVLIVLVAVLAFGQSDLGFLEGYSGCRIIGYFNGPGDGSGYTGFRYYASLPYAQRGDFIQTNDYPPGCSQY